jgi:hypothetical protein
MVKQTTVRGVLATEAGHVSVPSWLAPLLMARWAIPQLDGVLWSRRVMRQFT